MGCPDQLGSSVALLLLAGGDHRAGRRYWEAMTREQLKEEGMRCESEVTTLGL